MSLHVHDLDLIWRVYCADAAPASGVTPKVPEVIARLPKGAPVPAPGERVELTNEARYGKPTATAEGEVIAVAVIVRPDPESFRNPRAEAAQPTLDGAEGHT